MTRHILAFRLLVVTAALCSSAQGTPPPNVLFIAIDDLNDWVGCLNGHDQALTPNIDGLAQRGTLFVNAHCAAPACNPSRAAVFSGRMPWVTGVWSNQSGSLDTLSPETKLLSTAFGDAGYRTFGTGKLLHSGGKESFDEYHTVSQRWSPLTKDAVEYSPAELPSKGTDDPRHVTTDSRGEPIVLPLNRMPSDRKPNAPAGESFDWGPFDVPDTDFGDTQITDWAISKLQEPNDQPIFLAVGYYRPHIPLWAPSRFFERFQNVRGRLPDVIPDDLADLTQTAREWALEPVTAGRHSTVIQHGQWHAAVEAYLACITYVDHEIGRLLAALDRSSLADDTVIVLWSDHGWHLGEKQHWGKWTGWERSTRVPLIIVPPKSRAAEFGLPGSRCDEPVGLIDLYPTLTELCGVKAGELDGRSLIPLLQDSRREIRDAVITMFDKGNGAVRTKRWRYIRYADGSEELYDHLADPHEWNNLAGDGLYAEQKDRLQGFIIQQYPSSD